MAQPIYLDFNATTPLEPSVAEVITRTLTEGWANPSSNSTSGRKARQIIEEARTNVARAIHADPSEIIFTSGGTESNNQVFYSVVREFKILHHNSHGDKIIPRPHIVLTNLEHDSITKLADFLGKIDEIESTMVCTRPSGAVSTSDMIAAVKENTVLVTVMHANNETGVIQPVEEIAEALRKLNEESGRNVRLHVDAAQSIGKIPVDVRALGCDYLTVVGHKFYGPRVGALYVRGLGREGGTTVMPLLCGGGQENGLRSGTENTPMIAGLGEACRLVVENLSLYSAHLALMRDHLEDQLEEAFGKDRIHVNGRSEESKRIPNTCNVSILGEGLSGRKILEVVPSVQAALGSACHANVFRPSTILLSMGIPSEVALCAIRMSVGRETTQ
eukprot:Ihof_evm5s191 gene=Ihof_evmTU5s191